MRKACARDGQGAGKADHWLTMFQLSMAAWSAVPFSWLIHFSIHCDSVQNAGGSGSRSSFSVSQPPVVKRICRYLGEPSTRGPVRNARVAWSKGTYERLTLSIVSSYEVE